MSGKVVKAAMPVLNNEGTVDVNCKEKADICVKIFQDVHNSKSMREDGIRAKEEVLKAKNGNYIMNMNMKEISHIMDFSL